MSLQRKIRSVERLFRELELEMKEFREESGLKCLPQCGFCCTRPDIKATVAEFLPLAWSLYRSGKAENFLGEMEIIPFSVCPLFRNLKEVGQKGFCSNYLYRGLVCRLFGYAAMINKNGEPELSTCRLIKNEQPEEYIRTSKEIKSNMKIPVYRNFYQKLKNIDPSDSFELFPVEVAIKKALEKVLWDRDLHKRAS